MLFSLSLSLPLFFFLSSSECAFWFCSYKPDCCGRRCCFVTAYIPATFCLQRDNYSRRAKFHANTKGLTNKKRSCAMLKLKLHVRNCIKHCSLCFFSSCLVSAHITLRLILWRTLWLTLRIVVPRKKKTNLCLSCRSIPQSSCEPRNQSWVEEAIHIWIQIRKQPLKGNISL